MGMSTHVVGFKPADEKWHKMKEVWSACMRAKIDPPSIVQEFFNHTTPDERGVQVDLTLNCLSTYTDDGSSGYEVDLTKLPKDVTVIRFYNSW